VDWVVLQRVDWVGTQDNLEASDFEENAGQLGLENTLEEEEFLKRQVVLLQKRLEGVVVGLVHLCSASEVDQAGEALVVLLPLRVSLVQLLDRVLLRDEQLSFALQDDQGSHLLIWGVEMVAECSHFSVTSLSLFLHQNSLHGFDLLVFFALGKENDQISGPIFPHSEQIFFVSIP